MTPEEVQVLQVGASPVMLISLQKGGLDGAMLQDPSFFMAEDGGFKTLGDPAAMDIHYLQNVLAATRGYLRANRDLAAGLSGVSLKESPTTKRTRMRP